MSRNPAGNAYYHAGCPLCRAQKTADKEGRAMNLRDVLAAVRKGKKS